MRMDNNEALLPQHDIGLVLKAINASSSGIIITDNQQPDNPIIFCNDRFLEMTGYSRSDVIGRNCRFLQGEDRNQKARQTLREAVKKGKTVSVELRNYTKDGRMFWNELYMSPILDEDNKVTHFVGVQNDISRKKYVENKLQKTQEQFKEELDKRTRSLKESEEYLKSLVETIRESLVVLNADLEVLSVNNFFLKTFEVSESETVGKKLFELGDGQWDMPKLREMLEQVLPTQNPVVNFEVENEFPDIGKKVMILNAHQIEVEGSYKDRILLAIEDITERKEIERRKDDFLSIASHELKSPLTIVKGYNQLIEKLLPPEVDEKILQTIRKSMTNIDRLNNLITSLLDVSKIQAGKIEVHKEYFDLDEMVKETVDHVQSTSKTHTITIEGLTGKQCYGDRHRLEQVLTNLLNNAIKYSPKSTQVLVHLSQVSDYVKVAVTDFGLGIKREDKKKIFERFFRADNLQKKFPGMGIGLYVSEQIIKNHKGSLWVESEEGEGATFNFTLPLKTEEDEQ